MFSADPAGLNIFVLEEGDTSSEAMALRTTWDAVRFSSWFFSSTLSSSRNPYFRLNLDERIG